MFRPYAAYTQENSCLGSATIQNHARFCTLLEVRSTLRSLWSGTYLVIHELLVSFFKHVSTPNSVLPTSSIPGLRNPSGYFGLFTKRPIVLFSAILNLPNNTVPHHLSPEGAMYQGDRRGLHRYRIARTSKLVTLHQYIAKFHQHHHTKLMWYDTDRDLYTYQL